MRLNVIKDNPGSHKERIRIGRGIGSGMGKMGGRGGKGQTARSGVRLGGFEGGQMPLYRRLPKRGFKSMNRRDYNEINLGTLQAAIDAKRIDASQPVTVETLVAAGLLRRPLEGLRLLGEGEVTSKISITVNHATASAKAALEKSGGKLTLIVRKVLPDDEAKRAKTAAKKAKAGGKKSSAVE